MTPATAAHHDSLAPAGDLPAEIDVAIIGGGFSGLAMAHELQRAGREYVILERAQDVGGTWRDNTYPGCGCDVPSHVYSLSFALNPDWSNTFSRQPEILDYIRRTAFEHGLLERIAFGCEVETAQWDADAGCWRITTSRGTLRARALLSAAGPLVEPSIPDVPGIAEFPGAVFHSARWDHDYDLHGKRVAVIGTGASAIQFVPEIAPQVASLAVFQRTAPWIVPRTARPISRFERALYRAFPAAQRLVRNAILYGRETFAIPMLDVRLSFITRRLALKHLERQVPDPDLRRKLTPTYAPGCKRILPSNTYLPTFLRENVELVTEGLAEVRGNRAVGADGTEVEVDAIIFGTGFQVTDVPIAHRIHDASGRSLAEHWAQTGVQAHRSTMAAGFPNLYFVLGPNSGSGHMSAIYYAEAQARYIAQGLEHPVTEPRAEAQAAWTSEVQRRSRGTVWLAGGCASYYLDRHGRNPSLWPDFAFRYARALRRFEPGEHVITPAPARVPERESVAA